jgi:hypothetical protein
MRGVLPCDCVCHNVDHPGMMEFMPCCGNMGIKYITKDGIDLQMYYANVRMTTLPESKQKKRVYSGRTKLL